MIVYTDLHNRTKNYSLSESIKSKISKDFNVKIVTDIHPEAEIYWGDKLTVHRLRAMPNLKWIHLSKTGTEIIDEVKTSKHIMVTNTPESSEGVAEYALTGVLYCIRGINEIHNLRLQSNLNRESFDCNIDYILPFKDVKCLIVGNGRIGKKLNILLNRLRIQVGVVDKTNIKHLENLVPDYDIIVNALPLNDQTKYLFDHNIFGKMKKSSYIVNIGRGKTIVEDPYLLEALRSKQIRGAFLDVVTDSPIKSDNELLKLDNVFVSPHIANATNKSIEIQVKRFTENLQEYKELKERNA